MRQDRWYNFTNYILLNKKQKYKEQITKKKIKLKKTLKSKKKNTFIGERFF